jgi:predicted DNA binding protein
VEWELTASHYRLSTLGEQLDEFGIKFDVEYVRDQHGGAQKLLTDRQLRLLTTAVEDGYYDTPRKISLTELADDLGIAKSTASETLHRAEEKVVKQHIDIDSHEWASPVDVGG